MRVAAQHLPVLVAGDQRHLFDGEARFEQTARALVAQVVEVEILDRKVMAGTGEGRARRLVVIGEDTVVLAAADGALFLDQSQGVEAGDGQAWNGVSGRKIGVYEVDLPD